MESQSNPFVWSVASRTFYRQILSLLYRSFSLLKLPPPACPGTTCMYVCICIIYPPQNHSKIFHQQQSLKIMPLRFSKKNPPPHLQKPKKTAHVFHRFFSSEKNSRKTPKNPTKKNTKACPIHAALSISLFAKGAFCCGVPTGLGCPGKEDRI